MRRVRGVKFGTNVFNKMLLMLQNARVLPFLSLRENQHGERGEEGGVKLQLTADVDGQQL